MLVSTEHLAGPTDSLASLCPEFWKNSGAGLTESILEGYVRFLRVSRLQDRGIAARTGTHSRRSERGQSFEFSVYN